MTSPNPSPSTDRVLNVLEALYRSPRDLQLTELAAAADVSLSTCSAIAATLEERGYARRRVSGRNHYWSAGASLASPLGGESPLDIAEIAQPFLSRTAATYGCSAHVGVVRDGLLIYTAKAASAGFVQFDTFVGKAVPFSLTALGKAFVSALEPSDWETLLAATGASPAGRPRIAKSRSELEEELRAAKANGYATELEEEVVGVGCVAAPIVIGGKVVAAAGITTLAVNLVEGALPELAKAVQALANSIAEAAER